MNGKFWQLALAVGGFGTVGAFLFWSLYKQWLNLPIFSQLTPFQTFVLFIFFLVLVFLAFIAILWVYFYSQRPGSDTKKQRVEVLRAEQTKIQTRLGRVKQEVTAFPAQSKFKEAVNYLNERQRKLLAERAGTHALAEKAGTHAVETAPSANTYSSKQIGKFYWEIEALLELIQHCLFIEDRKLLNEPPIKLTLDSALYVTALKYVEQRIKPPIAMSKENIQELKECLKQLIKRIP